MSKENNIKTTFGRITSLLVLFVFVTALTSLAAQLMPDNASAAQVTTRSMTLGSSNPSTSTTLGITFTPVTTTQELIIDFCSNDPLVGDTCSFTAGTVPTIAASPTSNLGSASSVGAGTPIHTIKITGLTMTGASPFTVNITGGFTTPSTATTFYARILTYATGNASGYVPGNSSPATPTLGTYVDNGGIALSTASNILITSKVFETLTWCVFQTSCGTQANLALGAAGTGALDSTNTYVNNNAQYTIATNASTGVSVTMTGTTLCRPGGTCTTTGAQAFTISAIGSLHATKSVGTEQFGMCADVTGGTGLSVDNTYVDSINACHLQATGVYNAGTSQFGFNDANTVGGTNNAAGSRVIYSTGAVSSYTGTYTFIGDVAATTEAGIYTTSLNQVATGTF